MKYSNLIQFDPIENFVQLCQADKRSEAERQGMPQKFPFGSHPCRLYLCMERP